MFSVAKACYHKPFSNVALINTYPHMGVVDWEIPLVPATANLWSLLSNDASTTRPNATVPT